MPVRLLFLPLLVVFACPVACSYRPQDVGGIVTDANFTVTPRPAQLGQTLSAEVTLLAQDGTPAVDEIVSFSIDGNVLHATGGLNAATDSAGHCAVKLLATALGSANVTAQLLRSGAVPLPLGVESVSVGVADEVVQLTVNGGQPVVAGHTASVAGMLRRATDQAPVAGESITISSGDQNLVFDALSLTADGNGAFQATLTTTVAKTYSISAQAPRGNATQTFTCVADSPRAMQMTATPNTVAASLQGTARLTVSVADYYQNPIEGQAVTFAGEGAGVLLNTKVSASDARGQVINNVRGLVAGYSLLKAQTAGLEAAVEVGFTMGTCPNRVIRYPNPPAINLAGWVDGLQAADMDRDGQVDLVMGDQTSNNVSIAQSQNSGLFSAAFTYPNNAHPEGVKVGDLNGDGSPDVVTLNTDANSISVLLGDANGNLRPPVAYIVDGVPLGIAIGHFMRADAMAVAVLMGSGRVDVWTWTQGTLVLGPSVATVASPNFIVAADAPSGLSNVLLFSWTNPGFNAIAGGTFDSNTAIPLYGAANRYLIGALADVNTDGLLDAVLTVISSEIIAVALGNPDGTFANVVTYRIEPNDNSVQLRTGLAVADVTGDGVVDVITGELFRIDINQGVDGGFVLPASRAYNFSSFPVFITPLDIDGDNWLDLVIGDYTAQDVTLIINAGGGEFFAPSAYASPGVFSGTVSAGDFADLNGDTFTDAAVLNGNTLQIIMGDPDGNGDGAFALGSSVTFSSAVSQITLKDLNADGQTDAALINASNGAIFGLMGQGNARFSPAVVSPMAGYSITDFALGQINSDKYLDYVAVTANQNLLTGLGSANGAFAAPVQTPSLKAANAIALGDFDQDGNLDAALALNTNAIYVFTRPQGAAFTAGVGTINDTAYAQQSIYAADLNMDGDFDLVTLNINSPLTMSVFFGQGDGAFPREVSYRVQSGYGSVARIVDLDVDGKPDVLVGDAYGFNAFMNTGGGKLSTGRYYPSAGVGGGPVAITAVNANQDLVPDILTLGTYNLGPDNGYLMAHPAAGCPN